MKYDMNTFIIDRYMAILRLRRFGCEIPIPVHFGRFFWEFDPLNVAGYCRDAKRQIRGRKHAFWRMYCLDRLRNATSAPAEESKKKARKKEKKLRDVTSHIYAQTTHVALPPSKFLCGVGSQALSTMPSFIKIG